MNFRNVVFGAAYIICSLHSAYAVEEYQNPAMPGNLEPPRQEVAKDSKGVDIVSGSAQLSSGRVVSIGSGSSSLNSFASSHGIGKDNLAATITEFTLTTVLSDGTKYPSYMLGLPAGNYYKVDALGRSEVFRINATPYQNMRQTGGGLSCSGATCSYTTNTGDIVTFNRNYSNKWASSAACYPPATVQKNVALATKVVKADGEVLTYFYDNKTGYLVSGCSSSGPRTFDMPYAVISSLGWMIKYTYSDIEGIAGVETTAEISVLAINLTQDYCSPLGDTCNLLNGNVWPESRAYLHSTTQSTTTPSSFSSSTAAIEVLQPGETLKTSDSLQSGSTLQYQSMDSFTSAEGLIKKVTTNISRYTSVSGSYTLVNTWGHGVNRISKLEIGTQSYSYDYSDPTSVAGPDGTYNVSLGDRLNSFTDNLGRTTSFEYETWPLNRVNKVTRPDGSFTEYTYDTRGNITDIQEYPASGTNPLTTHAVYWTCSTSTQKYCNKPKSITDPNGNTTSFTYYAAHGGVNTITKPTTTITIDGTPKTVTPVTTYTYTAYKPSSFNSAGNWAAAPQNIYRVTKVTQCRTASTCTGNAEELVNITHYDVNQNLLPDYEITRTGNSGISLRTDFEYDIYGNMAKKSGPHPNDDSYFFYDLRQRLIGTIEPDSNGQGRIGTYNTYNADSQITNTKTGVLSATTLAALQTMSTDTEKTSTYSTTNGQVTKIVENGSDTVPIIVEMSYDNDFRIECKALRVSGSASDDACSADSGRFGSDRITKYVYDASGALTHEIGAFDTTVQRVNREHVYNSHGQKSQVKDGNGNTTQYSYDGYGRLEQTNYPSKTTAGNISSTDYTKLTFDGTLVKTTRLRNGTTITFNYDSWGRTISKTSPSNGTFGLINESFGYDNQSNVTSHTSTNTGTASTTTIADFNPLGWKEYETTSLGTVSYLYDAFGRRTRLTWPDSFYITYDYGNSMLLQSIKEKSTTTKLTSYAYDAQSRPDVMTFKNGVTTDYDYDDFSRLTSMFTNVGNTVTADDYNASFEYNPASQVSAKTVTVENGNYVYSKSAESQAYTPNGLNQITNWSGTALQYDTNGNLKKIGSTAYVYNNDNLLTKAGANDLQYDAEKRLYRVGNTCFLYDNQDLIAETNCSGTVLNRYVHNLNIDEPVTWYVGSGTGTKRYYTKDYLNSVIGITNSSGTSFAINSYDEYGIPDESNIGRFQFTGQLWLGEIGLYYYKARIYHPKLGRFMQTDPIGYEDGMNWYAYVGNDPINMFDPSGMEMECVTDEDGNETCTFTPDDSNDYTWKDGLIDGGLILFDVLNSPVSPTPDASIIVGARATARAVTKNQAAKKASEKFAKDIAKKIERDLGKKARREFHDVKTPGAGDRTKEELIEDAVSMYQSANKPVPSWLKSLGGL